MTGRILAAMACLTGPAAAGVEIDADYPGGNIIVERIDGDTAYLRQDLRDTKGWWFYWNFRVRGAAGRTLTFRLTNRNVIGTRGPAVSTDGGRSWSWLPAKAVTGGSFAYAFGKDAASVRFAFSLPYQERDLERFLARHEGTAHLSVAELCRTRKKRPVRRIHIGKIAGEPEHRVLLTCRHHACESVASYVIEGAMDALLAKTETGAWFREHVEVMAVPFMDKDGVEDGDQGKNRAPRDHNRDYIGESIYPAVRALRRFVPAWSGGKLHVAIDLHCPWIRGKNNEAVYLVGSSDDRIWKEQQAFSDILASLDGGIPYTKSSNVPFGTAWNTKKNYRSGKSCARWAGELPGIAMATTIEIPYANAGTVTIDADMTRAFGAKLVRAIRRRLQGPRK